MFPFSDFRLVAGRRGRDARFTIGVVAIVTIDCCSVGTASAAIGRWRNTLGGVALSVDSRVGILRCLLLAQAKTSVFQIREITSQPAEPTQNNTSTETCWMLE